MLRVGFVGWRGMVGSVLMERMREAGDLDGIEAVYYSTSDAGGSGPDGQPLGRADDLASLATLDVLITCQGGDWTLATHGPLRSRGWTGLWIDAASTLRQAPESTLVLDPINGRALREALAAGRSDFVGANCTVSILLMGLAGLLRTGEVEWISSMTYQAASGAGAAAMRELALQMRHLSQRAEPRLDDPAASALDLDRAIGAALADAPAETFGAPLAGSVLPWIDKPMPTGQTREEWKAEVEAARLLGFSVPIDGLCVRVGAMRSHALALTIACRRPIPLDEVSAVIAEAHPWVELVPNEREATLHRLTPAAVAGTLTVPVGRLRPMTLGPRYLAAFTVGDQLLWGAAEPLRRMLRIVREHREG